MVRICGMDSAGSGCSPVVGSCETVINLKVPYSDDKLIS